MLDPELLLLLVLADAVFVLFEIGVVRLVDEDVELGPEQAFWVSEG